MPGCLSLTGACPSSICRRRGISPWCLDCQRYVIVYNGEVYNCLRARRGPARPGNGVSRTFRHRGHPGRLCDLGARGDGRAPRSACLPSRCGTGKHERFRSSGIASASSLCTGVDSARCSCSPRSSRPFVAVPAGKRSWIAIPSVRLPALQLRSGATQHLPWRAQARARLHPDATKDENEPVIERYWDLRQVAEQRDFPNRAFHGRCGNCRRVRVISSLTPFAAV